MVSNLALFRLATYLATFQIIWQFFPNHLVTLAPNMTLSKVMPSQELNQEFNFFLKLSWYIKIHFQAPVNTLRLDRHLN
jgi:hypothetical protein